MGLHATYTSWGAGCAATVAHIGGERGEKGAIPAACGPCCMASPMAAPGHKDGQPLFSVNRFRSGLNYTTFVQQGTLTAWVCPWKAGGDGYSGLFLFADHPANALGFEKCYCTASALQPVQLGQPVTRSATGQPSHVSPPPHRFWDCF